METFLKLNVTNAKWFLWTLKSAISARKYFVYPVLKKSKNPKLDLNPKFVQNTTNIAVKREWTKILKIGFWKSLILPMIADRRKKLLVSKKIEGFQECIGMRSWLAILKVEIVHWTYLNTHAQTIATQTNSLKKSLSRTWRIHAPSKWWDVLNAKERSLYARQT